MALSRKLTNIKDVYDEAELKAINPNLRFLQEVDKRTGYRTKQQLVTPIVEQGGAELIGVIQIINNKAGRRRSGRSPKRGVSELAQTLAIAFRQRQKPQLVKTKYDYLISDAVLSAGEFELASRQARKKAIDIEAVLTDEFQVKLPAIGAALSKFFGVPYEAFKQDRVKPMDLLKNLKREYVEGNLWLADRRSEGRAVRAVPGSGADQELAHRVERVPEVEADLQGHDAEGIQGDGQPVLRRGGGRHRRRGRHAGEPRRRRGRWCAEGSAADEVSAAADNELVKLVNKIIIDAYNLGVSDIHVEPYPGKAKTEIRFRKDGDLQAYIEVPASYRAALAARLKIMCDLDISEKRKPQDGKIKFKKFGPLDIELRVATIPTAGGVEDVVMRILAAGEPIPLDKMGFTAHNLAELQKAVGKPYGLFFVCGPYRLGQDHHAALGAEVPEYAGYQDLDRGRPG